MAHRLSTRGRHAHRTNSTHPIRMKSAQGIGRLGAYLRDEISITVCVTDARKRLHLLVNSLLSDYYQTNIVLSVFYIGMFQDMFNRLWLT